MIEFNKPHKINTPEEKSYHNNLLDQHVTQTKTATRSRVIGITSWLNRISPQPCSVQTACDANQATSRCCWRLHHKLVKQKKGFDFLVR